MTDDTARQLEYLANRVRAHDNYIRTADRQRYMERLAAGQDPRTLPLGGPAAPPIGLNPGANYAGNEQPMIGMSNLLADPNFGTLNTTGTTIGTSATANGSWSAHYVLNSGTAPTTLRSFYQFTPSDKTNNPFHSSQCMIALTFGASVAVNMDVYLYPNTTAYTPALTPVLDWLVAALKAYRAHTDVTTSYDTITVTAELYDVTAAAVVASSAPIDYLAVGADTLFAMVAPFTASTTVFRAQSYRPRLKLHIVRSTGGANAIIFRVGEPQMHFNYTPSALPYTLITPPPPSTPGNYYYNGYTYNSFSPAAGCQVSLTKNHPLFEADVAHAVPFDTEDYDSDGFSAVVPQQITIDNTGATLGSYSFYGPGTSSTSSIAWNASAATVKAAIEASLDYDDVSVVLNGQIYTVTVNTPQWGADAPSLNTNTMDIAASILVTRDGGATVEIPTALGGKYRVSGVISWYDKTSSAADYTQAVAVMVNGATRAIVPTERKISGIASWGFTYSVMGSQLPPTILTLAAGDVVELWGFTYGDYDLGIAGRNTTGLDNWTPSDTPARSWMLLERVSD